MDVATKTHEGIMRTAHSTIGFVELTHEGLLRIAKATTESVCVGCLVNKPVSGMRGQCGGCYHATRRAIISGRTTEAARMRDGKLLGEKKPGRKPSNPVTREVA